MFRLFKSARPVSHRYPNLAFNYLRLSSSDAKITDKKIKESKPCSELTSAEIQSATTYITENQDKVRDIQDLCSFANRLYEKGEPGLCDFVNGKPYQLYRCGYPSVPSSMIVWFRGHNYSSRDLMASVHRFKEEVGNDYALENTQVPAFRLTNPEYKNNSFHYSMCETLAIMQHYGHPTRFLDWSSSIMNAAYFACMPDIRHDSKDGIIWILNPFRLNQAASLSNKAIGLALSDSFDAEIRSLQAVTDTYQELKEHADLLLRSKDRPELFNYADFREFISECIREQSLKEKMRYSIAVDLGSPNPRIAAQKGKFTIAGGKQYYNREEMKNCNNGDIFDAPISLFHQVEEIRKKNQMKESFLKCIKIESAYKAKIRSQLDNILGINEATMMLDGDSYGKNARNLYQVKRP